MASQQSNEYLLGANELELERLRFQHSVWSGITNAFFNRLKIVDLKSNQLCGGPASSAAEWMHRFFQSHIPLMAEKELCSASEADDIPQDWHAHRANPDALFFSPIVVDIAGRLPV